MKKIQAAIFDLDGTLLDSTDLWNQVDRQFLHKRGFLVPVGYAEAVGAMSFREAAEYTIRRFCLTDEPEVLMEEWNQLAYYAYGHTVQLKKHAAEYLLALKERGIKLAVATGLPPRLYLSALQNCGILPLFDALCSTEETQRGKEFPDVFLLAAQRLEVPTEHCMVFEDTLSAILSAKQTGMIVCAVLDEKTAGSWEKIRQAADRYVADFSTAPMI